MLQLLYTPLNSAEIAQCEIFCAKVSVFQQGWYKLLKGVLSKESIWFQEFIPNYKEGRWELAIQNTLLLITVLLALMNWNKYVLLGKSLILVLKILRSPGNSVS